MATATTSELAELEKQVEQAKKRLLEARRAQPPQEVQDYLLKAPDGADVRLSELFGDKSDLIVIHNMGKSCPYCTLWADGFVGTERHFQSRAGFVLVSADPPEVMREFAASRGWTFPTASNHGSEFAKDMGFWSSSGPHAGPLPGVSTFHRDSDGKIWRIACAFFGPGDDFCPTWPIFDLLKDGPGGWQPKYTY